MTQLNIHISFVVACNNHSNDDYDYNNELNYDDNNVDYVNYVYVD